MPTNTHLQVVNPLYYREYSTKIEAKAVFGVQKDFKMGFR